MHLFLSMAATIAVIVVVSSIVAAVVSSVVVAVIRLLCFPFCLALRRVFLPLLGWRFQGSGRDKRKKKKTTQPGQGKEKTERKTQKAEAKKERREQRKTEGGEGLYSPHKIGGAFVVAAYMYYEALYFSCLRRLPYLINYLTVVYTHPLTNQTCHLHR